MKDHFAHKFFAPTKYKSQPHAKYKEFNCCLIQYHFPLLKQCYILCYEPTSKSLITEDQLLAFAQSEAQRLSLQQTNSSQNFILAISGINIRKRENWHIHIFIVKNRWQKAYAYQVLAMKNLGLSLKQLFK